MTELTWRVFLFFGVKMNGKRGEGRRETGSWGQKPQKRQTDRQKKGERGGGQGPLKRERMCTGGALSGCS